MSDPADTQEAGPSSPRPVTTAKTPSTDAPTPNEPAADTEQDSTSTAQAPISTSTEPPESISIQPTSSAPEQSSGSTTPIPFTPAPHSLGHKEVPSAPPHAPPAKDLPTSTPARALTPTTKPAQAQASVSAPDVSEFDPFATPLPKPAGEGSGEGKAQARESGHGHEDAPEQGRKESVGVKATPVHTTAARQQQQQQHGTQTPTSRRDEGGAGGSGGAGPSSHSRSGSASAAAAGTTTGEPAFNFSGFLKDLRLKSADPVARYLKSFLSNFAKKPFTVNEQIKLIHDFLDFISGKMTQCEPWKSQSPAEFENAMEAMEKLVMNRLYNYTFTPQLVPSQPITTDDLERDAVFSQRVRLFGWIREKHLDVPEGEASQGFIGFAEQELLKINHYKAPRDKMICILNCCKVIFGLIRHVNGPDSTSADAFVPILIFVVLRANPENMLSNVEYINRFRTSAKLSGEGGYYLSSLSGAIAFIETMDASSLSNITQEEFESNVELAIQDLPPSPSSRTHKPLAPTEMSPFAPAAPGEEPARPLALSTSFAALDNTKRFFQKTGGAVTEAVSKPLNAISKIFDGMQDGEGEDGSTSGRSGDGGEEGSGDDAERVERRWRAGGARDRESEARQQFGEVRTPLRPANTRPFGGGQGLVTPESPSRRFAQLGLTPESGPPSRSATPNRDTGIPMPDFSSEDIQSTLDMSQEAYAQTRRANVQTLHQMFPALDEEIVEAVLESCGDDLGVAIDRLLEM